MSQNATPMTTVSGSTDTNIRSANSLLLVCFKLADEQYGVNITDIQEVIRPQRFTPVPQMPDFAIGVFNIRGSVVPVFDLRRKFKLPSCEFNHNTKIVVANIKGHVFGVVVDEILENIRMEASQVDPAPSVKMHVDRECIYGLGELEGRMIIILNFEKIHDNILRQIVGKDEKSAGTV